MPLRSARPPPRCVVQGYRYEELDAFVDIAPDNLLHNLQSDILELRNAAVAGQSAEAFAHSRDKRPLTLDDRAVIQRQRTFVATVGECLCALPGHRRVA